MKTEDRLMDKLDALFEQAQQISPEQDRQIRRFRGLPYEPGQRLRQIAYARFKASHWKRMNEGT